MIYFKGGSLRLFGKNNTILFQNSKDYTDIIKNDNLPSLQEWSKETVKQKTLLDRTLSFLEFPVEIILKSKQQKKSYMEINPNQQINKIEKAFSIITQYNKKIGSVALRKFYSLDMPYFL